MTAYAGANPRSQDILWTNRYAMTALGLALQDLLGTGTFIFGASVGPTAPASMSVLVAPGRIYAQAPLEPSAYSSLPSNSTSICKQGILLNGTTVACPAPITSGQSINYLIEGQYQENDTNLRTLSYWNSSNPDQPFSGANNDGISQPTVRAGQFIVQAKAGTAATTGTQTTPSTDAGWSPIAVVTVANGATTIIAGNISVAPSAPIANPLAQGSGSFTLTVASGLTTTPAGTCQWRSIGPMVTLLLPSTIAGVSNATGLTASGLPSNLQPATGMATQLIALPPVLDNTTSKAGGYLSIAAQSGTLSFGLLASLAGWTNSGSKSIPQASISYLTY